MGQTSKAGRGRARRAPAQQGEQLHRLSEPHVVGQDAPEAHPVEERQPGETSLLVGAQGAGEAGRGRHPLEPLVGRGRQQVADPALALDAEHGQAGGLLVEGRGEAEHLRQ